MGRWKPRLRAAGVGCAVLLIGAVVCIGVLGWLHRGRDPLDRPFISDASVRASDQSVLLSIATRAGHDYVLLDKDGAARATHLHRGATPGHAALLPNDDRVLFVAGDVGAQGVRLQVTSLDMASGVETALGTSSDDSLFVECADFKGRTLYVERSPLLLREPVENWPWELLGLDLKTGRTTKLTPSLSRKMDDHVDFKGLSADGAKGFLTQRSDVFAWRLGDTDHALGSAPPLFHFASNAVPMCITPDGSACMARVGEPENEYDPDSAAAEYELLLADGGGSRTAAQGRGIVYPSFSPDGNKLAWASLLNAAGSKAEFHVYDRATQTEGAKLRVKVEGRLRGVDWLDGDDLFAWSEKAYYKWHTSGDALTQLYHVSAAPQQQ